MNILITGGTGFIGSTLTKRLLQKGYNLIVLSRSLQDSSPSTKFIKSLSQINHNEKIDVVINLAGAPINKRWSNSYKQELINTLEQKPSLFISASAIGYYGTQNTEHLDENSSYVDDFPHKLCNLWESEAKKVAAAGVRTCIARIGVVLGKDGGALKEILLPFKFGLGGKIGSGKQFFSWVHIDDVINVFIFLIFNKRQKGIYNLTSPNPVTNANFTKKLGKIISRPIFFTIPEFLIKLIFGEMGNKLLLNGAAVYPKKLLDNGYEFKFETIEAALSNLTK